MQREKAFSLKGWQRLLKQVAIKTLKVQLDKFGKKQGLHTSVIQVRMDQELVVKIKCPMRSW